MRLYLALPTCQFALGLNRLDLVIVTSLSHRIGMLLLEPQEAHIALVLNTAKCRAEPVGPLGILQMHPQGLDGCLLLPDLQRIGLCALLGIKSLGDKQTLFPHLVHCWIPSQFHNLSDPLGSFGRLLIYRLVREHR